jgi:multiple sugar transport system substrate-binding protein
MWGRAVILAAALMLVPPGARAADLVVWWDHWTYPAADQAVRELVAAFEQTTGKQVELVFQVQAEHPDKIVAALEIDRPPDFSFGAWISSYISKWALDGRLADLTEAIGPRRDLFAPDALDWVMLLDATTGRRAFHALPMVRTTFLVHVWTSLLEQAGFTRADIPKEWQAFWSFWCEKVQPAVRKATGHDDVWAVGLSMSIGAGDTVDAYFQFLTAYGADYVTREGRLVIDEPQVRDRLIKALDDYTALYRKGCVPPDTVRWDDDSFNNKAFLAQRAVMTANMTLSIPNALKAKDPDDYYRNTATIEWPLGPGGERFPIHGFVLPAVVFNGSNVDAAKDFIRFLVEGGWLAQYFNLAGDLFMPTMPALLRQPFWLDPSDGHRMASVMQVETRPLTHDYVVASGDWRHDRVYHERVWSKAIHRVTTEGVSPEQAVDEAIARVKQILSE